MSSSITETEFFDAKSSLTDSLTELFDSDAAEKIGKASSSVIGKVAYDGGFFKKAGRAALISGGAIGIAALAATPPGWVLGAIAGGVFLTYMIAQYVMETKADQNRATAIYRCTDPHAKVSFGQMAAFKLSAMQRTMGLRGDNYNEVHRDEETRGRILLGHLPNKSIGDLETLRNKENVTAIVSINEPWERYDFGSSKPVRPDELKSNNIDYLPIQAKDHVRLTTDQLDAAAEFINRKVADGETVYVHCRAGVGRSAMGVAAALINKDTDRDVISVATQIKSSRTSSTIKKKIEGPGGLREYQAVLQERRVFT